MNDAVKAMLRSFGPLRTVQDEQNALQEILQRVTLLGLHRGGLLQKAAFYGGTALRILYDLDRFSEDLDFCLKEPDPTFTLQPYFAAVQQELERFDFSAKITEKRTGPDAAIESAFVKHSTQQGLLVIGKNSGRVQKGQLVKIRLEVDKHNPPGGEAIERLVQSPIPFLVKTLTLPSLFAGKIHAVLARAFLNRVKGRDFYDLAFYAARGTPVNMRYLEAKLRDSGHYTDASTLSIERVIEMLCDKFRSVDFKRAKEDVLPFVGETGAIAVQEWTADLFIALVKYLQSED